MKNRKHLALPAVVVLAVILLTGCAKEVPLPETTGEELGLYLLEGKVVDAEGNEYLAEDGTALYSLDAAGDVVTRIVNSKGKTETSIVVGAAKMPAYSYITETTVDEAGMKVEIPLYVLEDGAEVYRPLHTGFKLTIGPEDALNSKFKVTTADSNTVVFEDGNAVLESDGVGEHTIHVVVKYSGETKFMITNAKGDVIGVYTFVSVPEKVAEEDMEEAFAEEIASCEHEFRREVVEATEQAEGYTLHVCSKCGYRRT